jgi:NAD(P)H dehydrogenase (quinone)
MKYFIVYAHPEPRSLNGALKDAAIEALLAAGHEVQVSDLYAMNFKAVADAADFLARDPAARLVYHRASGEAYHGGTQAPDILAEQQKLLWADAVIFQFPLWWFSMPAIMKGWLDRVFAHGFAIGVTKPGTKQWLRYGEGNLAGRRAMIATTTGGRDTQYAPRGLNGPIEDLLFPTTHGVLFYTGMAVVPSFIGYRTVRLSEAEYAELAAAYVKRLLTIASVPPIPFRTENGGDFGEDSMLQPAVAADRTGFDVYRGAGP